MKKDKRDAIILTPVYNDWQSFYLLVERLNHIAANSKIINTLKIFAINDGSSTIPNYTILKNKNVGIIHLKNNVGHQKAITLGLAYVGKEKECDVVVVMDTDGEDRPEDIEKLLYESLQQPDKIIFAQRSKRHEGFLFKFLYRIYKFVFKTLTGKTVSFGNFSIIPFNFLNKLTNISEIWNHYSSGVIKSKMPYTVVSTERGERLADDSKMNLNSLILHGLSAVSVHIEIVSVRILLSIFVLMLLAVACILIVIGIRIFADIALPGWATYVVIGLIIFLMQAFIIALILVFIVLNYRTQKLFIPAEDYQGFILKVEEI